MFSQPRSVGGSPNSRCQPKNKTQLWIRTTLCTSNTDILEDSGLDAFFFLRYLQFLLKLFAFLAIISLSFVLPFNVVHGKGIAQGVQGLDRLTWASVDTGYQQHYWVHFCVTIAATICVCVSIFQEHQEYIRIRQLYLSSPRFQSSSGARTVLITAIPRQYSSRSALQTIYGKLPGGIKTITMIREPGSLVQKVRRRQTLLEDLEVSITKKIRRSILLETESHSRSYGRNAGIGTTAPTITSGTGRRHYNLLTRVLAEYRKKTSIEYKAQILSKLDAEIQLQTQYRAFPRYRSALVEFYSPYAAILAHQSIAYSRPFSFLTHFVGTSGNSILWDNLDQSVWQFYWRSFLAWAIVVLTITGWAVPIAFTGSLSQISYLSSTIPGFTGLSAIPTWLLGPIVGILPQMLLVILLTFVPVLFRTAALFQGYCTVGDTELAVQRYYFCFLFVQVFLTVSISSSITTIIRQIYHGIDSVPTMLATNLPKSSNYFLSYLLLQALSISSSRLLRPPGLVRWLFLRHAANATPRQKWRHEAVLQPPQWGTIFPVFTNLACIGERLVDFFGDCYAAKTTSNHLFGYSAID